METPTRKIRFELRNKTLLIGRERIGKLTNETARVLDSDKQLEILFDYQTKQDLCKTHTGNIYAITGIPDTFVKLPIDMTRLETDLEKLRTNKTLTRQKRDISFSLEEHNKKKKEYYINKRYNTAFAWGTIQKMEVDNYEQLYLTFKDQNSEPTLENFTNQDFINLKQETGQSTHLQSLVYLIDRTIKLEEKDLCLHAASEESLFLKKCDNNPSTWIFSTHKNQLKESSSLKCLTYVNRKVVLKPCNKELYNDEFPVQYWSFDVINDNPEIVSMNTETEAVELEWVRTHLKTRPRQQLRDFTDIILWGKLSTRKQSQILCVTINETNWELNLANCTAKGDDGKDQLLRTISIT